MAEFDGLIEVIVYVEDMDRMLSFYSDVLGFDVAEGHPDHGFVKLDVGTTSLCLHAGRDGDLGEYAPKLVFEVADLEEAGAYLREHDVELGRQRNPAPGVHVIDGRDPEGNKFSIESSADVA